MRKILFLLITLFSIYFIFEICVKYFGTGHFVEYKVGDFNVKETLTQNNKKEIDNYYLEISKDDLTFTYKIENIKKGSKIIKEIKYFENSNYKCIMPILNAKNKINGMCLKDDIYYNYSQISGSDPEIDNFFKDYSETYYNNDRILKDNSNLYVYDNLISDDFLAIEHYKGIYIINSTGYKKINLFKKETYEKNISTVVDKYYLVADYDEDYEFHKFYIVNLENNRKYTIISDNAISFNSYIQGVIDNSVYLIDKDNKIQYRIDIKSKNILVIGNEKKAKKYVNGEFVETGIYEMVENEVLFNNYSIEDKTNEKYSKIDFIGNEKTGFYYYYLKTKNGYKVYKASINNPNKLIYLFETTNMNSVKYNGFNIYFVNGEYIYAYDSSKTRLITRYIDMAYNEKLKFYVY